jgi:drug/metabolite transporter (DMT)-like permease
MSGEVSGEASGGGDGDRDEAARRGELIGYGLLLSCVAVWGVTAVAFKTCTRPASGVGFDPVFLTGLRFLVVAPCLLAVVGWRRPADLRLERGDWLRYAVFGFVAIVLAETLQPLALRHSSVANVTLLSHGTLSLFTALWALALFKQRITRSGWVGAALALVGVGLVASSGSAGGFRFDAESLKGDAVALFRSVEHSCYLLLLADWLRKRPVAQVTVYNATFGALWLLPYTLWKGLSFPWSQIAPLTWAAFAWTVVPTTLYGFLAWNWAMSRVGAIAATNMFYLLPVAAAFSAWALLGEPVTAGQMVGGAVIIVGVVLLRWEALTAAGLIRLPEGWPRLPWRR